MVQSNLWSQQVKRKRRNNMEFLIALATKFWQWSLLILFVIIGFAINLLDRKKASSVAFTYNE